MTPLGAVAIVDQINMNKWLVAKFIPSFMQKPWWKGLDFML